MLSLLMAHSPIFERKREQTNGKSGKRSAFARLTDHWRCRSLSLIGLAIFVAARLLSVAAMRARVNCFSLPRLRGKRIVSVFELRRSLLSLSPPICDCELIAIKFFLNISLGILYFVSFSKGSCRSLALDSNRPSTFILSNFSNTFAAALAFGPVHVARSQSVAGTLCLISIPSGHVWLGVCS